MQIIKMKIADLKHPDKNVRYHNEKQITEFKRSLEKFGQIRPIVVDENNVIRCGNGLYEAMVALGYETADVLKKTDLSENDKKKLMIADNRIYGLGVDNLTVINEFFEELKGDLDIPGYDEDILNTIVSDAEEITEKLSDFGTLDDEEIEYMKAGSVKREQEALSQYDNTSISGTNDNATPIVSVSSVSNDTVETIDNTVPSDGNKSFIVCPKCGEKIWL